MEVTSSDNILCLPTNYTAEFASEFRECHTRIEIKIQDKNHGEKRRTPCPRTGPSRTIDSSGDYLLTVLVVEFGGMRFLLNYDIFIKL